ncbi:MAG: aspartate aminotransferase family protein [Rhodobacteraceae bacterium]|nr:aspartate aminotransferase family protein [Paracoccaceae bacterium]
MVNGFDPATLSELPGDISDLVGRRQRLLGPAYRLFYKTPVQVSRGEGVFLYDDDGREYLDCYNNVVSVGHANPRVTAAIKAQIGTLSTHTRYVQAAILDFAEDLLSTFEAELQHVMFTCTGTEANDLALRMAMHHTGRRGIVITSEAYHGNSFLVAGCSPSLGDNQPLWPWARRVPAPDPYRVTGRDIGAYMAAQVFDAIADLERQGEGIAAFMADSLFSSDGVISDPVPVLAQVAEVVRKAGGVMIADEVQAGFGRSGSHLWGYQRHGFVPDIVTMGKPMGNGYPVAAVVMRGDVVERFGSELRYFNTFGGNNVAIAAAQAVLDVVRDEGLVAHAGQLGAALRTGLEALAGRHEAIGCIRGTGLYYGVEMVADRDSKTPDPTEALRVVNRLRDERILISATGPHANVLKIRPPLVLQQAHVDRFLDGLDRVLSEGRT